MNQLITIGAGVVAAFIGIAILASARETAGDLDRARRGTPVPQGAFNSGSVGCAGIAFVLVGIAIVILGIVFR